MKTEQKHSKIIDIIYWGIIAIMTIVMLYNVILKDVNISDLQNQNMTIKEVITMISSMILICVIIVILNMFRVFFLTVGYFGIKIALRKHNKEKLEQIDLRNDKYYRDILPKYSPAVLSYLDDFKIDSNDITATLLMLELKGKIKINNNGINLLDESIDNLEDNEVYVLNKVREKDLKHINLIEYQAIVMGDALKNDLLIEKQNMRNSIKKKIFTNIILYSFVWLAFFAIPKLFLNGGSSNDPLVIFGLIFAMILFALLIFMPGAIIIYIYNYKMLNKLDPYVRNDQGKILNEKLEGLRKYLLDYGKIQEKEKEQLILWEDYLIYSVIFGINTKVSEEIQKKY